MRHGGVSGLAVLPLTEVVNNKRSSSLFFVPVCSDVRFCYSYSETLQGTAIWLSRKWRADPDVGMWATLWSRPGCLWCHFLLQQLLLIDVFTVHHVIHFFYDVYRLELKLKSREAYLTNAYFLYIEFHPWKKLRADHFINRYCCLKISVMFIYLIWVLERCQMCTWD